MPLTCLAGGMPVPSVGVPVGTLFVFGDDGYVTYGSIHGETRKRNTSRELHPMLFQNCYISSGDVRVAAVQ